MSHASPSLVKFEEGRDLNMIPVGCLWLLMKIQRVMEMTKTELRNVAACPQKVSVKRTKITSESHFCGKDTRCNHQLQSECEIPVCLFS